MHFAQQSQMGRFDGDDQPDRLRVAVESDLDVCLHQLDQVACAAGRLAADSAVTPQFLP